MGIFSILLLKGQSRENWMCYRWWARKANNLWRRTSDIFLTLLVAYSFLNLNFKFFIRKKLPLELQWGNRPENTISEVIGNALIHFLGAVEEY